MTVHERHVRLFKNDGNQAVRIPIEPAPPRSLLALLAKLAPLNEDFPPISDPHPEPVAL